LACNASLLHVLIPEEADWDLAPEGYKKCISKDLEEDSDIWLKKSDHTIGSL
jgi:hypothetical protein